MRGRHLRRALGSDHRANTGVTLNAEVQAKDRDVSAAWAIAFAVCVSCSRWSFRFSSGKLDLERGR